MNTQPFLENAEDLYQNAPFGYMTVRADGLIVNVNATLLKWLGYEWEEILRQKSFQDLLDMGGKIYFETHMMPMLHMQGEISEINIELKGKASIKLPTLVNASRIHDQSALETYFRFSILDITQRKSYELELIKARQEAEQTIQRLKQINAELEQFAYIASHDLQEPLRMITSFLDQLKRKYGGQLDDKAHQYIHFATDGAKRMKQIILDLLEYSRAGKHEENRVKLNLDQLVTDYKSLRKKIIYDKSVLILHPPVPVIDGYRAPFTQVIHCLLDNAIKYSREGIAPRIELGVEETESEWVFSVRDNGIGIAPEFFDKIFVIFQRLHNRNQYDGNGIGLSIVKKQVESWGGKVWLESTVGEGSAFYFTVPKN